MGGLRLARLAAVSALVAAALATAGPVSAAPPTHIQSSTLGATASLRFEEPGSYASSDVSVTMTDEASGLASLWIIQSVSRMDADGNYLGMVSYLQGGGDVQLTVDSKLESAHASGTLMVTRGTCNEWGWCSETNSWASIDATWTATSEMMRAHTTMIGSASRTSRTVYHTGSTYRFATAEVLVDGVSLGASSLDSSANIYDSRNSMVEMYFGGGEIPGTVKAIPPGAGKSHGPKPSGDPSDWEPGTTGNSSLDLADASWYDNDGSVAVSRWLAARYRTTRVQNDFVVVNEVVYEEEVTTSDWSQVLQTVSATGQGTLVLTSTLSGASLTGTLDATICTAISDYEQVCLDGVQIPVDVTWAAAGPVSRTFGNQHATSIDGDSIHWTNKTMQCDAIASGTLGDLVLPESGSGLLGHDDYRTDVNM